MEFPISKCDYQRNIKLYIYIYAVYICSQLMAPSAREQFCWTKHQWCINVRTALSLGQAIAACFLWRRHRGEFGKMQKCHLYHWIPLHSTGFHWTADGTKALQLLACHCDRGWRRSSSSMGTLLSWLGHSTELLHIDPVIRSTYRMGYTTVAVYLAH